MEKFGDCQNCFWFLAYAKFKSQNTKEIQNLNCQMVTSEPGMSHKFFLEPSWKPCVQHNKFKFVPHKCLLYNRSKRSTSIKAYNTLSSIANKLYAIILNHPLEQKPNTVIKI